MEGLEHKKKQQFHIILSSSRKKSIDLGSYLTNFYLLQVCIFQKYILNITLYYIDINEQYYSKSTSKIISGHFKNICSMLTLLKDMVL